MIRRIGLWATAVATGVVAISTAALAADMPVKAPPAVVVVAAYNWAGFYVGVNAGYAWGRTNGEEIAPIVPPAFNGVGSTGAFKSSGFTGGVTAGYNWWVSNFLFGVEADANWLDRSKTITGTLGNAATSFHTGSGFFGTLRGRAGLTFDRALMYMTGGISAIQHNSFVSDPPPGTLLSAKTKLRLGWVVGGGVEYALNYNWSTKVEYLHIDSGASNVAAPTGFGTIPQYRIAHRDNVIRVGLNYKFSSPLVARY